MKLENLHAYMHINNLVNGTAEVLFMGQPALTIQKNGLGGYCWAINHVFAKLTYGANVLSDVPYCDSHYESIEHAAAEGMAKLEEMGAFKTITELPDDTYSNAKKFVDDDIATHALTKGNMNESIKYMTAIKLRSHVPEFSIAHLSEKILTESELSESEKIARAEYALMGKNIFKSGLVSEEAGDRLVSKHEQENRLAKVYKRPETGEHVVKFFEDGKHQKDADYFTDDKHDAQGTAKHWISQLKVAEATRSEFDANVALEKPAEKKSKVRIIGPTGGTVSKHDSLGDAKRTFVMKKFSTKTHTIKEEIDGVESDITALFEDEESHYNKWVADVKAKHGDKKISFRHRIEKGSHTTSVEVPGEDRSYAVYDHDAKTAHIFEESEEPVGELIEEREMTAAEEAKRDEIASVLKSRKGFVSKYGKDAIFAVASQMAKTAGA